MNKRKIITGTLALATLLIVAVSCVKKVGKLPTAAPPPPVSFCDTITYAKHIKKIIDDNCVSCHEPANTQGSTMLTTYELVKQRAEEGRIKVRAIDDNGPTRMPQPPNPALTQQQKDLITCWLNNGMKQ